MALVLLDSILELSKISITVPEPIERADADPAITSQYERVLTPVPAVVIDVVFMLLVFILQYVAWILAAEDVDRGNLIEQELKSVSTPDVALAVVLAPVLLSAQKLKLSLPEDAELENKVIPVVAILPVQLVRLMPAVAPEEVNEIPVLFKQLILHEVKFTIELEEPVTARQKAEFV